MATGTVSNTIVPPPLPANIEHEQVIERQLSRTSLHVRLVDLGASLAIWIVGVLAVLLLAVVADHWIGGLGTFGRVIASLMLIGGSIWFWAVRIVPLLIRGINPTYAARTIEEATPTLKNSLVNFLMLRRDHSGVREVVFQAVEAKAASDIAAVPVEATVDRSRLIRAGYVLCGVMAVFAAYKILSPKDPFPTVARVIAPWADIARPSRVEITDVKPGDAEVYHGQIITASAIVSGVREGDPVTLLYTTADGQTVDHPVKMSVDSGGLRYQCTLPPADLAGLSAATDGLRQDATYRLVAGDAETPEYTLAVVAAPTIIVERLEYQYPAYTKKAPETVPQAGDIKALEGTKVAVHAVANQPIKSAWLEFDPGVKDAVPEVVQLAAEGSRAWGTITLQLKPDRKTPWHAAYQVRFYNERGQRSQQPIIHKIEVIRDLPPEVQLLQPQRLKVEVPEDGEQAIEVRALDPDFGLSRVGIDGTVAGKEAVAIELLDQNEGQPPQATKRYAFKPKEHGLKAGDELKYVAVAADNRTSPLTGQPEPNVTKTAEYTIVVVPPRQQGEQANNPQQQPMPGDMPPMPEGDKPQGDKPPPNAGQQENMPPKPGEQENPKPMQGDKQQGDKQGDEQQGDKSQPGNPQQGDKQQGDKQQGDQQQGDKQQGDQQQGDKSQAGNPQQGQPQEGGQGDKTQAGQPQQGGSQAGSSNKSQSGDPQQGQPMNGGQADGSQAGQPSGQPSGDSQQPAGQQGDPNADASGQPNSAGGPNGKAHDGQAIEEVLKEIQKQGQRQPNQSGNPQQRGNPSGADDSPMPGENAQPSQNQPMPDAPGGEKTQGDKAQGNQAQGNQAQGEKPEGSSPQGGQPQGQDPQGQEPAEGATSPGDDSQKPAQSGAKGSGTDPKSKLGGDDQKLNPMDKGAGGQGEKVDPQQQLPGDKQGQNPSEQKSQGNKGGESQGADKTDKADASKPGQGEKKDPGAGDSGDEGAGKNSTDKTGNGQAQEANRDKPKELQPDGSNPQESEPSPPSGSKRQSDSKGGESGDQSSGGGKGAGQSAGQEGNDSPGSKSAADQGAGAAEETGSGETGSQAGTQKSAAGKTGQSGDKQGEGSQSKSGNQGDKSGSPAGKSNDKNQGDGGDKPGKSGGAGPVVGGGGDGDRPQLDPTEHPEAEAADAANLEYARKATEMVLQRLKDQEQKPDPDLLDKLGWSEDDLAEFIRRWDALQKSADKTPAGQRELDEALRSLGLRDPANRQRAGGATSDSQRDLRDSGGRSNPPAKYRDLFDAFRKGAARSSE